MSEQNFREKYRPKFFSEVVGNKNKNVVKILTNIVKSGRIPTGMLLHGPPGSGKNTLTTIGYWNAHNKPQALITFGWANRK